MKSIAFLLFIFISHVAAARAQEPAGSAQQVGVADIYLAKDDGSGKAGEAATGFVTTDVPIYCVVQLDAAVPVTVKMNLIAVKVPGVKPETRVVSTSYATKENQSRVNFTGRPAGRWVAGKYRVDIFIGDAPAVSRQFVVSHSSLPKTVTEGLAEPKPKSTRQARKT